MGNIVAIVGRPNVGKSTMFNRLTESRKAIIDEMSGVTRDRNYGKVEWNGKEFSLIDTGGYVEDCDEIFEKEIKRQVILAIEEADIILFVVDVIAGITPSDEIVADILRRHNKKVLLVVNKVDNNIRGFDIHEFYKLGFNNIFSLSSISGSGTGELLDEITQHVLPDISENEDIPRFAIVGRPNVGKSSLINILLGEERNIVTDIPGTTRDSIFTLYNKFNHKFYLVDTAGLRKKSKVRDNIEFYSVMRAIRTIEESDVCILLIDAISGIESQDMKILQVALHNKKGIVIIVNKWDLIEKDNSTTKKYIEQIKEKTAPFTDVPIVFTSVIEKQRILSIIDKAVEVYGNCSKRISTSVLNNIMAKHITAHGPPAVKGKLIKIKYVTQLPTKTPAFAFFCNLPQYINESYGRYLENKIREEFNFTGVPIQIFFRKK